MNIHPYYPQDVGLSGNIFAENHCAVATLITVFATGLSVLLGSVLLGVRRVNRNLCIVDIALILWFVMCECTPRNTRMSWLSTAGTIHLFFEGFFVFNNSHVAGMQTFFAQLWKEYALSDSRYMVSDPLVLCSRSYPFLSSQPLSQHFCLPSHVANCREWIAVVGPRETPSWMLTLKSLVETLTVVWDPVVHKNWQLTNIDPLGSFVSTDGYSHNNLLAISSSSPSSGVHGAPVWESYLPIDQLVWRPLHRAAVLSSRAILFLGLLRFL